MDIEEQYDKIYRYCYFKLGQRSIAEDITQETFLHFLESDTYKNQGKALHYLYTIARNLCIDEYRKNKRENDVSSIFSENDISMTSEINKEKYAANNNKTEEQIIISVTLQQALAKLSEQDRELILLKYVNELPVSVISKLLKISRFAVYRRLNHTLNLLKQKLQEEGW